MSLYYNSHDFQYKADFGSGDTPVLVLLPRRAHAHDLLLVSVLVSEVKLKLSIIWCAKMENIQIQNFIIFYR
jgi:hypothetical protein